MRLLRFRVTNFRSVMDSGWIDVDDVTALIGTNESGKTNLLLPLWKLNPANEGEIDTTTDYPRKLFNDFRSATPQPVFITAVFEVGAEVRNQLESLAQAVSGGLDELEVTRAFDGTRTYSFPRNVPIRSIQSERVLAILDAAASEIIALAPLKSELELHSQMGADRAMSRGFQHVGQSLRGVRLDAGRCLHDERTFS